MNDNEKYHADITRISKSGLDLIHKAPAKYYAHYIDPNRDPEKRTEALIDGGAFHTIILEPDKFDKEFVVSPVFRGEGSMKARSDFAKANAGKDIITMETYNKVSRMRDAVMEHPVANKIFSNSGLIEKQFNWEDQITNAPCKIKPDFHSTKYNVTADLKSTEDASDDAFGRSAFKYRYHVQAPFYIDGLGENGIKSESFMFVAAEKSPPYLVSVYFIEPDEMNLGRRTYVDDLKVYMKCRTENNWPGYGNEIRPLKLPGWTKNL